MQCCPGSTISKLHRREVDGMEIHVVLPHELVKVNVLLVEPPLLPLGGVIRRYAGVTNWCVILYGGLDQNVRTKSARRTQTSEWDQRQCTIN